MREVHEEHANLTKTKSTFREGGITCISKKNYFLPIPGNKIQLIAAFQGKSKKAMKRATISGRLWGSKRNLPDEHSKTRQPKQGERLIKVALEASHPAEITLRHNREVAKL